ncbi:polysaccharide biosynthesis/export family protein [Chelativorans sp. AA-79]|uniref:polysaccharide biosynthesis/export family protein n=1 Tax=Chelativorans sp. AA-79 TaxID=3028735 RepID=UPI0023F72399|nr:polysaccharide biosynthesis/export family protein [Chelativorans sp. AA-79]WEX10248.1 polysaccharide export protein [Chelativorans sp. AA-79]
MTVRIAPFQALRRSFSGLVLLLLLSACSTLPGQGPTAMDIALGESSNSLPMDNYILVRLDSAEISKINSFVPPAQEGKLVATLGGARPITVGVGDTLAVNIWEASPDGLFSTAENKQVSLQVVVDGTGEIFVPYAGNIRAAGRSVEALRRAIQQSLEGQAAEPQVQVLVAENKSNNVVVVGDVAKAGHFPLPAQGLRLIEVIAQAGGTRAPAYETVASVTRGAGRVTLRLHDVVSSPENNIWLAPGDTVLVKHEPRTYSAFGAVASSGLVSLKTETVTLAEALAQVGGLRDNTADMGGVYLFRFEDAELMRWLTNSDQKSRVPLAHGGTVPVVYALDFKRPYAFFVAQEFRIRDKDILYVANHPTAEFGKFLATIVQPLLGTARSATTLTQ